MREMVAILNSELTLIINDVAASNYKDNVPCILVQVFQNGFHVCSNFGCSNHHRVVSYGVDLIISKSVSMAGGWIWISYAGS